MQAANPTAPIAVGTRGTVGSLVRKEIEFFSRVERRAEKRPQASQSIEPGRSGSSKSHNSSTRPGFWLFGLSWRRKKQRVGGVFRSSGCAVMDVSDADRSNGVRGFSYVNLRDEFKNFQSY